MIRIAITPPPTIAATLPLSSIGPALHRRVDPVRADDNGLSRQSPIRAALGGNEDGRAELQVRPSWRDRR